MPTVWFSADHHFFHKNIIRLCSRSFETLAEMHEVLISNWNNRVKPSDKVFYLGDFSLGKTEETDTIIQRLNGEIFFIEGNHDRWIKQYSGWSDRIHLLSPLETLNFKGQIVVLCHYALREWNRSYRGSWHLFAHSHGSKNPMGLSFDVGVDCWAYNPISFEEVLKKIKSLDKNSTLC